MRSRWLRFAEAGVFGMLLLVVLIFAAAAGARLGIAGPRYNLTASVPVGLYLYVPGAVHRGETVQCCLPARLAEYALQHHLLLDGSCPKTGVEPLVKVLAAAAGDVVDVTPTGVAINGRRWPLSAALTTDAHGAPLAVRVRPGRYVMAHDEMFLMGVHSRSWDSRYFGAMPASSVTGRWIPLLTLSERTT
ncbi:MAG: conjugative transfer signal peptidase TraF [Vulcanimicrobiaceae bacterium]